MATTEYGVNATKRDVNVPSKKIAPGEVNGQIKVAYDEFSPAAAITINSVIKMMKLPAGARVIDVLIKTTDLGSAGVFDVGWEANGVEAADADGFFAALDVNTAAINKLMAATAAVDGVFKKFSAETQISITVTTATTAAGKIQLAVFYIVD